MEKEVEEKIISLETKLAYLEDFINQLQAVSVEHTETIERLRAENKILSQKLNAFYFRRRRYVRIVKVELGP